ncbi:hypothetical protein Tco_1328981 [Tanacetum coccineum]
MELAHRHAPFSRYNFSGRRKRGKDYYEGMYELPFYYLGQNVSVKDLDLEDAFEERQLKHGHTISSSDIDVDISS